jgi:hypothetical protein
MAYTDLSSGTIVFEAVGVLADGDDADLTPDLELLTGVVMLTPNVGIWRQIGTDSSMRIVAARPLVCQLVNGKLVAPDGKTVLRVLATDAPNLQPSSFQWVATFQLSGISTQPAPVTFNLPAGTTVNLASVLNVGAQPNVVTVVSEQSRLDAIAAANRAEAEADRAQTIADSIGTGTPGEGGTGDGTDLVARQSAADAQQRADDAYALGAAAYVLPAGGIPETSLATAFREAIANIRTTAEGAQTSATNAQTTANGKYSRPAGGIGTTDLAQAVLDSLAKANSALQSAPVTSVAGKTGAVTLAKGDVGLGLVDNTSDAAKPLSTATTNALAAKADLVGGLIPSSQIPATSIVDTVVVGSEAEMLALTSSQVQKGDIAVRTDGAGTFILKTSNPTAIANWQRLNAPTDAVTSVNGQLGTVVLGKSDVGLANVDNTSDAAKPVSTATQTALTGKAAAVHTHTASDISDSTTFGRGVVTAASAAAARATIGAGTGSSDLVLGTTAGTAKPGNYAPASTDISDSTATGRSVITAASQSAARTSLGITGTGQDGQQGAQGVPGGFILLASGATSAPANTPVGTLVGYRS